MRGKFTAIDDLDMAGHHIRDWRWLDDLPTRGAQDGQVLTFEDGHVSWADTTVPTHTHPLSDIEQSGATSGQVVTWNSTANAWEPKTPTGGGGGGGGDVTSVLAGNFISVNTSIGDVTVTNTMTWTTLPNKPASFTPASHNHVASEITQGTFSGSGGAVFVFPGTAQVTRNLTLRHDGTANAGVRFETSSSTRTFQMYMPYDDNVILRFAADRTTTGTNFQLLTLRRDTERVGVNTASPSYRLDVNGGINGTTITQGGTQVSLVGHTHSLSGITQSGASAGQVATWNSTAAQWEPQTPSGSSFSTIDGDTPLTPGTDGVLGNGRVATAYGNVSSGANRQTISPYIPSRTYSIKAAGFRLVTASGAGTTGVVLVFDADANGRPTDLLFQSAALATDGAAGTRYDTAATFTFTASKMYWVGLWTESTPVYSGLNVGACYQLGYIAASNVFARALVRNEAYGGTSTDWTYADSQLNTVQPPVVLFVVA